MKVRDLHRETKSKKVAKPKLTTDFPGAVVREGADESPCEHTKKVCCAPSSTPRMLETNDGGLRWLTRIGMPFCQAIFQGVEGPEWDYHFQDLHQAVKSKTSGENKKTNVLWTMNEAKNKGLDYCDTKHHEDIQTGCQLRLDLWVMHLRSPTAALTKALEYLEQGENAQSLTSEW